MRYEKGHKEETRKRVVEIAAKRFRKDGIEATGIASLMKEAGLTHGGFYAHFASKESLVGEALIAALGATHERWENAPAAGDDPLEAFITYYLSARHRDHPDRGCALAALATEIARHPSETRAQLDESIEALIAQIARKLPASVPAKKRFERARAVFSVVLGALQMARTLPDGAASEAFLSAGREAARALAKAG